MVNRDNVRVAMKSTRRSIFTAALVAGSLISAEAFALHSQKGIPELGLETASGIAPVRRAVQVSYTSIPKARSAAWNAFLMDTGSEHWQVMWDSSTAVPLRIFGKGIDAPGVMRDAEAAEKHALLWIRRHAGLLAPGVDIDHLLPVSNELSDGMRVIGFKQFASDGKGNWLPVLGGQLSLRYKNDRLFVLASEVIPGARAEAAAIDLKTAEKSARIYMEQSFGRADVLGTSELVILPLIGARAYSAKTVWRVRVKAGKVNGEALPFDVYIDANTGVPVAREMQARFLTATALFDVPTRYPGEPVSEPPWPAKFASININGANGATDSLGAFSWAGPGDGTLMIGAQGNEVKVSNASGAAASATFSVQDGGQAVWAAAGDELLDAQLTAFIHATRVKEYARGIAPQLPFLNSTLYANVNKNDQQFACNAYWDGTSVNFFVQSGPCNNTGRLADVIYHEVGHGLHQNAAIGGIAMLDPALGEGQSDYLACTITGDPNMAPGFFVTGGVLRHCLNDRRWPIDIDADPHETGLIFTGAMWDLRTALVAAYGEKEGVAKADALYYGAIQRSSSIPATYAEVLASDDDDGNLENGTPNLCLINEAFINHGIAPYLTASGVTIQHSAHSIVKPNAGPLPVVVNKTVLYPQCGTADLESIRLQWGPDTIVNKVEMQPSPEGYSAEIPQAADGSALRYRIVAKAGINTLTLPDNAADDEYRVFVGNVEPIYCNDFETQIDGWNFSDVNGAKGDFKWGIPEGIGDDPATAYSGSKVIGNDITIDGEYESDREVYADSPVIDLQGNIKVRLQFRRWLNVEDGYYDQATIYVNGKPRWFNEGTDQSFGALVHTDKEWRFEDIDLTQIPATGGTTVQVRFELASDSGFEAGGWTIDDFCIMAWKPEPPPVEPPPVDNMPMPPDNNNNLGDNTEVASGCGCAMQSKSPWGGFALFIAASALAFARIRNRKLIVRRGALRN